MFFILFNLFKNYIISYNQIQINDLNNDIILNIIKFLNENDLRIFSILNKNFNILTKNKCLKIKKKYKKKKINLLINFPRWFHNLFHYNILININILDFNKKFLGNTDYIDNIDTKDVIDDLMIGVDYYKRPFFCLRDINNNIVTFFQRYSDDKYCWTIGKNNYSKIDNFRVNNNFLEKDKINLIKSNSRFFIKNKIK